MNKKRFFLGCLYKIGIFILFLFLLFIINGLYRHFYKIGDIDFTFWKTGKGCYITPYKYWGITPPEENYMKASNLGGVVIFVGEDTTLYIFPEFTYYGYGSDSIECNFSFYKYRYFPYINEIEHIEYIKEISDYYKNKKKYPYINIYIGEMHAEFGNLYKNKN